MNAHANLMLTLPIFPVPDEAVFPTAPFEGRESPALKGCRGDKRAVGTSHEGRDVREGTANPVAVVPTQLGVHRMRLAAAVWRGGR